MLAIAASLDGKGAMVRYRIYDHGEVVLTETVVKRRLGLKDLTDIIDTRVCACSGRADVDVVGIALPGVLHDGVIELPPRRTHDLTLGNDSFAIADYFEGLYDIPIFFWNNANCAALGWYGSQDECESVVFYSQPLGWIIGGQGTVVGGRLIGRLLRAHPAGHGALLPAEA